MRWSRVTRLLGAELALLTIVRGAERPASEIADRAGVTVNVRDFGAQGDGRVHSVREWIESGRFRSLRALRKDYPFIDGDDWSTDEAAFARAKLALPPGGGTIYFPAGHYVAAKQPWTILQDGVRLQGDGPEQTILSTGPRVAEGLVLAPYRHGGWLEGANREFPYAADSGARGTDGVQLKSADWATEFHSGDLIFIRNGANRFDQDYGEFNEVAGVDAGGRVLLKHPLARDYTLARLNWAGEVARDFTVPGRGREVTVAVRTEPGYFQPAVNVTVSVGDSIFRVAKAGPGWLVLADPGRANAPRGTLVPAGSKIGKSRTLIRLTRTVRDFRCQGMQVIGRRNALNLSNTYGSEFTDCTFVRDAREGGFRGGLTVDGDGGRFAQFRHCRFVATPPNGMQLARSFGNASFVDCAFVDTNVAFTEFAFAGEVSRCSFAVHGTPALTSVIIAGKSCGDLRLLDNQVRAVGVATVFDASADIQSQRHGGEGGLQIRGNRVEIEGGGRVYLLPKSPEVIVDDNEVRGGPERSAK